MSWTDIRLTAQGQVTVHGAAERLAENSIFRISERKISGYLVVTVVRLGTGAVS